jgi:hypothetical protein
MKHNDFVMTTQPTDTEKTKQRADQLDGLLLKVTNLCNAFSTSSHQISVGQESLRCQASYWKHMASIEESYAAM